MGNCNIHSRSRDRRRTRSRTRSRDRYSKRSRDRYDRSPDRWRGGSPGRESRRIPDASRPERRDVIDILSMPFAPRNSPPRNAKLDMTSDERDERTIFIQQLARDTRPRDLEQFFSSVGHVRDVRVITDTKSRRSKGIAYVEFWEKEAVPLAMGLNGQRIHNAPLVIQISYAERNRAAAVPIPHGVIGLGLTSTAGPLKLQVGNLHPNISEDMLNDIFEPFGRIVSCRVQRDGVGSSKGIGTIIFRHTEEGKRALEQLNGFELAGRSLRITALDDEDEKPTTYSGYGYSGTTTTTEVTKSSKDAVEEPSLSGQANGVQLMGKLAQNAGETMQKSISAYGMPPVPPYQSSQQNSEGIPAIATQCFMLSNMFDLREIETEPGWDLDIRDDVIDECNSHGGCSHVYIDRSSSHGNVYVKCLDILTAYKSVQALHGRWFAGKVITANYVPLVSYDQLFPDSLAAQQLLLPRPRQM